MASTVSQALDIKQDIPTFLPLPEAAGQYGLSEKVLTQLVQAGKIEAVQLPSGELLVSANNGSTPKTKAQIIAEEFASLRARPITISEAVERYEVPDSTIRNWVSLKYIDTVDKKKYPMTIDEADVAYCAKIYRERGGKSGTRLFDEDGNPYQLKHPKLAEYRRRKIETDSS
jgi:hypothetical protein